MISWLKVETELNSRDCCSAGQRWRHAEVLRAPGPVLRLRQRPQPAGREEELAPPLRGEIQQPGHRQHSPGERPGCG